MVEPVNLKPSVLVAIILLAGSIGFLAWQANKPASAEWVLAGSSAALVIVTAVLAWATWNLYLSTGQLAMIEKRSAERARVLSDMEMYVDIASGNRWGWKPGDVSSRDGADYVAWDEWRRRCIGYQPRFYDPTMKAFYDEWVPMLQQQKSLDRSGQV